MQDFSQLSDNDLSELLRKDEEPAFREIYLRYFSRVYRAALKRLNNTYEAEEVVQDIFCNLWKRRKEFSLSKGFDCYFSGAVKFEVINRLAKRARQAACKKELALSFDESDYSTQYALNLHELTEQFQRSVYELPEKCRLVFRLKYENEYTQREIARELNISEKTVEAHLSKARKKLHDALANLSGLLLLLFIR